MNDRFAETLRAYRKEAGLTQTELAEKAGVSLETIWKTEKGKSYPRLDVCAAIAGALGCTTSELIGERPAGDIAELKIANRKLALSLVAAQCDMALLDACEICAYYVRGTCEAPKDITESGTCFAWRGKTV